MQGLLKKATLYIRGWSTFDNKAAQSRLIWALLQQEVATTLTTTPATWVPLVKFTFASIRIWELFSYQSPFYKQNIHLSPFQRKFVESYNPQPRTLLSYGISVNIIHIEKVFINATSAFSTPQCTRTKRPLISVRTIIITLRRRHQQPSAQLETAKTPYHRDVPFPQRVAFFILMAISLLLLLQIYQGR